MRFSTLTLGAVLIAAAVSAQQPGALPPRQQLPPQQQLPGAQPAGANKINFTDTKQKYSYSIGLNIGNNLKGKVDTEMLMRGFHDALSGAQPALTDTEMQQVMQAFQQEMADAESREFKQANDGFLAAYQKQPGVTALPSGLMFKVIKPGTGATPKASDTVTVHYTGKLVDGSVFDSSVQRGQPATFPVGGVIAGWTEALQKMKVGDKWELAIPGNLAYGAQGRPPQIPPNSVLVFEVELLGIGK